MTTSPTPREKRRARRLRGIKTAALDLVIEDGVDQFSIHKLADRVELTAGALYRYFDSRDEILVAIQLEVLDGFQHYLDAVLSTLEDAAPLERVVHLCRAYVALQDLQPERFRLIAYLVAAPDPLFEDEVVQPALMRTFELLGRLEQTIAQAQASSALTTGDATQRATICWSSVQALVERKKLMRFSPGEFERDVLVDDLLRALLVGWGGRPDSVDEALQMKLEMETLVAALPKD